MKLFVINIRISKDGFVCILHTFHHRLEHATKMGGRRGVELLVDMLVFCGLLHDPVGFKGLYQLSQLTLGPDEVGSIVRDNIGWCPPP